MDLALRSACLKASVVPMSGLIAPLRIATPMPECAIVVGGVSILPLPARLSVIGAARIATSKGAPSSIFTFNAAAGPKVMSILFPVAFSNCGTSSSRVVFTAVEANSLISAACAPLASSANADPMIGAITRGIFIVFSSMLSDERKNFFVETFRLLPCDRVPRIGHNSPFMVFDVMSPNSHQGRRRQQIGIRRHDKGGRWDGFDLGKSVGAAKGLVGGLKLARMLLDLDPAPGAVHVRAAIGGPDLPVDRR